MIADFSLEDKYRGIVCGIDEVGRGPLAGPVVAACVIIPPNMRNLDFIDDIKDSKKLSKKKRSYLFKKITTNFPYAIGEIPPQEIDKINILQASLLAMKKAHDQIRNIEYSLVDGNKTPDISSNAITVIKGDQKSKSIAAASIIAKIYRDRIMFELAKKYPNYGWERNSGYPTKEHKEALLIHGITPHHRRSFKPVSDFIESKQ